MQPMGMKQPDHMSKYFYPCQGPKRDAGDPQAAQDTGKFTIDAMDCRPDATDPKLRSRESGFQTKAVKADLPRYKCYFDDSLAIMWASPAKKQHMQTMGFLDKCGGIVDIHERRRGYFLAEKDIKRMEQIGAEHKRDREVDRKRQETLTEREYVTQQRLARIAAERDKKRLRRAGGSMAQSTGSLPSYMP
mmetsp:Transcript_82704/g.267785  ORF Transcript_82704/g.267785 Transcript_82704/m.267785 type:complete len:190 (-) Transcript_82704:261-830(-)